MSSIRAVIVDHSKANHITLGRIDTPIVQAAQALVRVQSISLNPGDFLGAASAKDGAPIGWDLAGTVLQQAVDGSGPRTGDRVVGLIVTNGWGGETPGIGGWAEQVAVPTTQLAIIPDAVTFAQAVTLPIAGLTALYALEKAGPLWQKRVLIVAASGGVGDFAVQIAHSAGAYVVGTVRNPQRAAFVRENGANKVCVGDTIIDAAQFGPYDLIIDSIGGQTLASALSMLASNGLCVTIGFAGNPEVTFYPLSLFQIGGTGLYALALFHEFQQKSAAPALSRLVQAVADGSLKPHIEVERSWEDIEQLAQKMMNRAYTGKVVLHIQ